MIITYPTTL